MMWQGRTKSDREVRTATTILLYTSIAPPMRQKEKSTSSTTREKSTRSMTRYCKERRDVGRKYHFS